LISIIWPVFVMWIFGTYSSHKVILYAY
jgi:hypothetical protein